MLLRTCFENEKDPVDKSIFEVLCKNSEFAFIFEGIECYYANNNILQSTCKAMVQVIFRKNNIAQTGVIFINNSMKNKPLDEYFKGILWHEIGHILDTDVYVRLSEFMHMEEDEKYNHAIECEYIADLYASSKVGYDVMLELLTSELLYHSDMMNQGYIRHIKDRISNLELHKNK